MPSRAAKAARSSSAAARLGSTPGAGLHSTSAPTSVGMPFQKAQRLSGGRGDGDEMIRRGKADGAGERFEILHQHVVGEFLAHLFRQAGAALVVAQHAKSRGEPRRDRVPRIERAAKLVHQHDGGPARAGKLVMQAHAIGVDEGHGVSRQNSQPTR